MSIAGAGMLPGAGAVPDLGQSLGVSSALTSSISNFGNLPITGQFSNIVSSATGALNGSTLSNLRTLGADVFPALTNAIPGDFVGSLATLAPGGVYDGGFTGLINSTATGLMGSGDLTKFGQIFNSAQGYAGQANQFVNSTINLSGISTTFGPLTGGMDNLTTGSFNQVSEAFGAFGSDLGNLGNLIDMDNLPNLGSPSALVGQLASVGGLVPGVETALRQAGVDSTGLTNLVAQGSTPLSDSVNKALYDGLTKVTGSDLAQVKNVLGVRTPGINTMADLLNPVKILPNSYTTLTMPTPDGLRGIYASADTVNTNIEKFLQDPNAPAYTGDDPIVLARLGLPPVEATI
jgi:hypothetical protein